MRLSPLILLIATGVAWADPTPEEEAFLRVPGATRPERNPDQIFLVADLPSGMVEILRGYDWGAPDGALRSLLRGFTFDLNKDGKPEYFFATIYGGSGGPDYMILTEVASRWKVIGGFQGALHVMSSSSGWPDLVTTSRGGGGIWAKVRHSFRKGKYGRIFIERYVRGVVTSNTLPGD